MDKRVFHIPVIMGMAGFSYLTEFVLGRTHDPQDIERRKYWMHWLDPRLKEHWDRYLNPTPEQAQESLYHRGKNVASERAKINAQLVAKGEAFYFMVSVVQTILATILAVIVLLVTLGVL